MKSQRINKGVARAVIRVGSQAALARACKVSQPAVAKWLKIYCPAERAVEIERISGVPRGEIRPDIFS